MEIRDGLIAHHRVYWGWLGLATLTGGTHPGEPARGARWAVSRPAGARPTRR